MEIELTTILKGIGTVLGFAVLYIFKEKPFKFYRSIAQKRALDKWSQGIEDSMVIGHELSRLHFEHGIPRNAFFVAHNGGSIAVHDSDFYTSVKDAEGVTSSGGSLKSHMYTEFGLKITVDSHYRRMVDSARINNMVVMNVDDMPSSILKDIYKSEDIEECIVVYYCFNAYTKMFSFASHARYKGSEPFTQDQIQAIIRSGNRIRTRFKGRV